MDDLISRQAAIDALGAEPEVWSGKDEYEQGLNNQWHYDVNALKSLPSAQPKIKCIANITMTDEQVQEVFEKVKAEILAARPKRCEYCNADSDGYVKPIEKNGHAFVRCGADMRDDFAEHMNPPED